MFSIENTLLLAFSLGLLHALDADHVMAVSGLSARKPTFKQCLRFCYQWATGHGFALLVIASSVYIFGLAVPETLSAYAEALVAVMLIAIGLFVLWDIHKLKLNLSFHRHEPDIHHAHWHQENHKKSNDHSALLVGLLHGTAGSAPLLVMLPLSQMGSVTMAMSYVLLFGLGVILAMVIFGGLMAKGYQVIDKYGTKFITLVRSIVALSALGLGSHLLIGNL